MRRIGWRGSALVALVLVSVVASRVGAQEPEVPKGGGPLPDFSKGAKAGAIVTAQHIHLYRSLLPPEVAELVERGEFAFEVAKIPREPARFISVFEQVSELTSSGELKNAPVMPLRSGLFSPGQSVSGEVKHFAFKILWNAAASLWRYRSLAVGISTLLFTAPEAAPHKLEFLVERIHPRALGAPSSTLIPLFREKISAKKPSVIDGLSWLTLRYFGTSEDFVWIASPVIRSIRQVTGSNRSDQIFSGAFSPDDLFVWSGKVEFVEPLSITQMPLLVPILEVKAAAATTQDACTAVTYKAESALTLQCQTPRFTGSAKWTPTNTLMVLRSVYRIEFSSRDPYSLETRHVLYVDRESGLPVYRVVWDQAGRRKKMVLGVIRALELGAGHAVPVLAGQIVFHSQDGRRVAMIHDSFTSCETYVPGRRLEDFDPSSFVQFTSLPVADSKTKATKPLDEEASPHFS